MQGGHIVIKPETSFDSLKTNVISAISSYFPFDDGKRQKIVLNSITVDDKLSVDDIRSQAEAKDHGRTWGVPVVANLSLIDKITGKTIDNRKMTLAVLPKLTNRYGLIVGGNEYQVDHLFRLKSGVYARVQQNGELESEFNLAKKIGSNFSIHLDPKTERFSFLYDNSHIPLYPILKVMGVADDDLEKEWGPKIFNTNKFDRRNEKALEKFFAKTGDTSEPPKSEKELHNYVHHYFNQTALLPETTKITMGKPFTKVDGEVLRLASNKILGVSRQTHEPDDRDSLAFKDVVSVEDFIPEKLLNRQAARNIKARLRQTVDHKKTITEIVTPELFRRPINDLFSTGDAKVIERSEQTNPIQMMAGHRKTTLFSDLGGINNKNAINEAMQVINPSHFGFLDPMHTPESEKTGVTLYLSASVRKNGKDLEAPAFNLKSGKSEFVKVPDFHSAAAVLPDQVKWKNGKPVPISPMVKMKMPGGAIELRPFKEAHYVLPSAKGLFDFTSNLIPFLPTDQGNRVSMADKQMEQAISLKHREAPLVQSKTEGAHTFEKSIGSFSSTLSPITGKVLEVKSDSIVVHDGKKKHEVQIYNHFPLNDSKGMMHSNPVVKVGDSVKQGQLLADTNFTRNGHLAVGMNLRVGYMPYKGYNFEDGIVISETAAKKLTSDHLYKKNLEVDPDVDIINKAKWQAFASRKATDLAKDQLDALDEDGVIRVGSKVRAGSVLIAALAKNTSTKQGSALAALGSRYNKFFAWKDKSLTWDEEHAGEVIKVIKSPNGKGVKVYVRTDEPMVVGDKISGRHGNKGIVTQIIPDHEMPFTTDAKGERRPLEVILNPSGVPTRINVGQILETAAGKIAEKTGKAYVVNNFAGPKHDYRQQVVDDLKSHGLHDEEHVYDPKDPSKAMGSVLVGPQYLMKLRHQVEKKLSVRGGGTTVDNKALTYSLDRQPVKGGSSGGQGFGQLEMYSLLGHGARNNIREMSTYKSDKQDDSFWVRIQQGFEPPTPQVPFSYKKFEALLRGAGINLHKEGTSLKLMPMVDKEVLRMAGGGKNEITKGHLLLRSKDLREEKHGLFDPQATGGVEGDKWSFIRMAEPLPNPMFVGGGNSVGPIPTLLGLQVEEVDQIMAGKKTLHGKIGGAAFRDALSKIDVDKEIHAALEATKIKTGTLLNRANKKLKFLTALKETGLSPVEAYMTSVLPILPPVFRPVTPNDRGDVNVTPLNQHYKNFAIINQKIKEVDPKIFSDEHRNPLRSDLWESYKALQGVGRYRPVYDEANGKRKLKGILEVIGGSGEGDQPKEGFFQSKLIKRRQNLSIRSTIIPEPSLHIDQVGLPKNAAMELYKPFVVAQLGRWGIDPLAARTEMKNGTDFAFKALEAVVKDRPILLKRDPALHKFSVMAFQPKLIEGKAIQIHPLVTGGFNADFDGDSIDLDTPIPLRFSGIAQQVTGRRLAEVLDAGEGNWISNIASGRLEAYTYNGWKPIKTVSFHKVEDKKKFRITLKNGISFIASEDHSLMVGRKEVKPADVQIGIELDHTSTSIPFTSDKYIQEGSYELGVIYGNFLGDGSAEVRPKPQYGGRISIACKPEEERKYLIDLWKKNFNVHVTDSTHGYFQVSNAELAQRFLASCGRYCTGKAVMGTLMAHGDEFLKGMLAGYIQSDGSVELTKSGSWLVRTWSKSKTLRDDMAFIASALGIPFSVRDREHKCGPCYLLSFGKEAIKLLDYRIPGKKGDLLKKAREDYETNRKDTRRSQSARGFEVKSIEEVEYHDRMIDIEVDDESHVFAIFGGVIVHNTMAGTVPLSREAVDEAKKMFPSKNLFSPTTGGVMYTPSQEAMLGLHLVTKWGKKTTKNFKDGAEVDKAADRGDINHTDVFKLNGKETTLGRMRMAAWLPKGMSMRQDVLHNPAFDLNKKTMNQMATDLAKNHQEHFAESINALKDLGNEFAFKSAFSIGLKDLKPLPQRDAILASANKEAAHARKTTKSKTDLDHKLVAIYSKATQEIDAAAKKHFSATGAGHENRLATMVYSGARGKPEQLRQMIAAPMLMQDATNRTIPVPVTRSYSEGLDVGDYWLAQHGARKGTLQRAQGTSEPGAMSKEILNSTMQYLVTKDDCGTPDGVLMDLGHEDIHDRYTAKPYKMKDGKTLTQGTLITPEVWSRLKNSKHEKVVVRSPLKCHNGEGLCAKCFGLNEGGNLHDVGTNIGILAGQALGEPAVQMAMDAFHSGGIAGGGRGAQSVSRFERLNNLLGMTKLLRNEATLSKAHGRVTDIKRYEEGTGGFNIVVDGVTHQHRNTMPVSVKIGDTVRKGDALTEGQVNPLHLLKHTDMANVQNHLTNELYLGLYKKEGVRRRNVETVVRAITNLTRIKSPGDSNFIHGDIAPLSVVEKTNREMGKPHGHIQHEPLLMPVKDLPLRSEDWMARLNFQQIKKTLIEGAARGFKSDLHGSHPIPGVAYGAEFGKPPPGKKKHVY